MNMEQKIHNLLCENFKIHVLEIIDESEKHRGHGGWREGGGTHFFIKLRADVFMGMTPIEAQRTVYKVLAPAFGDGLHALSLDVKTPE